MTKEAASFRKVPVKKPKKEPQAALKAFFAVLLLIISPKKAPAKGPIIMPNGGKRNKPKINPMVLPQTPTFDPPYRLVPYTGTK